MSNIQKKLSASSELNFAAHIAALISNNEAYFYPKTSKIIMLRAHASGFYLIGRDNKNVPYIGIQEEMTPWFTEQKWKKIVKTKTEHDKNYLYLISEENGIPINALGIIVRQKRQIVFNDPNLKNNFFNMKICKIIDSENTGISYKNVIENMEFIIVDNIDSIFKEENSKEVFNNGNENKDLYLVKNKNKNK